MRVSIFSFSSISGNMSFTTAMINQLHDARVMVVNVKYISLFVRNRTDSTEREMRVEAMHKCIVMLLCFTCKVCLCLGKEGGCKNMLMKCNLLLEITSPDETR